MRRQSLYEVTREKNNYICLCRKVTEMMFIDSTRLHKSIRIVDRSALEQSDGATADMAADAVIDSATETEIDAFSRRHVEC